MKKTEWAYLAGIIDGEGCINSIKGTGHTYHAQIGVSQRDIAVILWIRDTLKLGRFRYDIDISRYNGSRDINKWLVSQAPEVRVILRGIYPYLTYKKPQAAIAHRLTCNPRPNKPTQFAIHQRLKELKHV